MNVDRILVVSAHALDYLWRCGGTIARYAETGNDVKVIDLTCGERGESNAIWNKQPGITEEKVAGLRKMEAEHAASLLGAEIEFMGWQDHMLEATRERVVDLAKKIMEYQPTILLTHYISDPMNPDHPAAAKLVMEALRCAQSSGVFPGIKPCGPCSLYLFEPAYTEAVGYVPEIYIDITDTMDVKMRAMEAAGAQRTLADAYDKRNGYRGHLASKFSGNPDIRYAETFVRFKPYVGKWFC